MIEVFICLIIALAIVIALLVVILLKIIYFEKLYIDIRDIDTKHIVEMIKISNGGLLRALKEYDKRWSK